MRSFDTIKKHSKYIMDSYGTRNDDWDKTEEAVLMDWKDKPTASELKVTVSPSARNQFKGFVRLLTAAGAKFKMPYDKNDLVARSMSNDIEKFANAMWYASSRILQKPQEIEGITAAGMFGEIQIGITQTKDKLQYLRNHNKGDENAARILRAERIAARTPIMFEVYDSRTGYGEFDNQMGLLSCYRRMTMGGSQLGARFGKIEGKEPAATRQYILNDFLDDELHTQWVDGMEKPLIHEAHKLPKMPVEIQRIEGSHIHKEAKYHAQSWLYTLMKSELWQRENLTWTMIFTNLFNMAKNPAYIAKLKDITRDLKTDNSISGGVWKLYSDEDIRSMLKDAIPPEMLTILQMTAEKIAESTIYKQALGEPLGANAPFSMVSLLSQAGRLPLIESKVLGGWCFGNSMQTGLEFLRLEGGQAKVMGPSSLISLRPADIPEYFTIECELRMDLAQDQRANAALAAELTRPENPITSNRFARELINVEQSEDMDIEIYEEQAFNAMAQKVLEVMVMQFASEIGGGETIPTEQGGGGIQVPTGQTNPNMIPTNESTGATMNVPGNALTQPVTPPGEMMPPEGEETLPPEGM